MLPKTKRIKDPEAIEAARRPYCVFCGYSGGDLQVHHIHTKGSGGGDTEDNLICLCVVCHARAHSGEISKKELEWFLDVDLKRRAHE
jgi:5-methylcytosine-specific restriction endonuclease McrA